MRGIVFLVAAGAAPLATTVAVFPVITSASESTVSPLFFVVAAAALAVFAVGFTRIANEVKDGGAFYDYIHAGLGRIPGRGAATLALVAYAMLFVALVAYLGAATAGTVEYFTGTPTPWWVWSAGWLLVTGVLAYRDIALSTKVLGISLVLEVAIMVVLDFVMVFRGGPDGRTAAALNPLHFTEGTPSLGLMFAFFGFVGFEATVVFRSEARDPHRTIPRATYLSIFGIGLFYAFSLFAVTVGAGPEGVVSKSADSPQTLLTDLARTFLGVVAQDGVQVLVLISIFGCFLTFHNVLARYTFNFGSAGLLPAALGQAHPRHHAPSRASVAVTILCAVAIILAVMLRLDPVTDVYTWLSGAATLGIITLMAMTSLAVLVFFRGPDRGPWVATRLAPACALLAFATLMVLVVMNFPSLVGGEGVAIVLISVLLVALIGGATTAAIGAQTTRTPHRESRPGA
ncbi:APC family permease [Rhodococcus sp. T2V]|uniref:APC family permease n=1 Tax=Rhodococcus sp. T2V TaxID=3034164 RepID=UPI0023E2A0A4|nr:APC family permease [Rhodococcus sp. T2V]MDF3311630.1 APC family permease [Rhodococcus sp. T2V]